MGVWRRQWHPTPVLLPGKSHGWRSLVGCSPWGCYKSDTTKQLHFHFSFSRTGEGNGNPLQCPCLENLRDGGLVGCRLWGCTESDTTEVTQQQQQQIVSWGVKLGGMCKESVKVHSVCTREECKELIHFCHTIHCLKNFYLFFFEFCAVLFIFFF